jgi:NADH dehydrogenase/NADH:ubiquinone oxidoreductase subunit G
MPKVKVKIDGVEVLQGAAVLQACALAGKAIPRFCYHRRRIEERKGRTLEAAA